MSIRAWIPSSFLIAAVLFAACGPRDPVAIDDAGTPAPVPAVTSISPEGGPFNDRVTVTLTTDVPATIFLTRDGSDPAKDSAERLTGEGTLTLELTQSATLKFFSRTSEGADEAIHSVEFIRAGGKAGTISGVVVVGTVAVDHALALLGGQDRLDLGAVSEPGEVPFTLTGLDSGTFRLRAMSDRNDDGSFFPVVDDTSAPVEVTLDLADPFKASAEGVRLYLGAAGPGTCAVEGTITHPKPLAGETLRMSALSPSGFGQGGDPTALLSQLQNGYLILVDPAQTEYPYAVTDLEPGRYVLSPALTSLGGGGLGITFLANPLQQVDCTEGEVATADFEFGPVALNGTVTLQPATPPSQNFVYGVVAARTASLTSGLQVVLMPAVFAPVPNTSDFTAGFAGRALRSNSTFSVRVFSSLDSTNPIGDALTWSLAVFGGAPAHATVKTTTVDATASVVVPLP